MRCSNRFIANNLNLNVKRVRWDPNLYDLRFVSAPTALEAVRARLEVNELRDDRSDPTDSPDRYFCLAVGDDPHRDLSGVALQRVPEFSSPSGQLRAGLPGFCALGDQLSGLGGNGWQRQPLRSVELGRDGAEQSQEALGSLTALDGRCVSGRIASTCR